jgi:hypothetical protein
MLLVPWSTRYTVHEYLPTQLMHTHPKKDFGAWEMCVVVLQGV